jgi:two-component system, sensor histidine kinase and response regulator
MHGYVAKPINQDRLFYTLWRFLQNRKRGLEEKDSIDVGSAVPSSEERIFSSPGDISAVPGPGTEDTQVPVQLHGIDVQAVMQSTGLDWQTFRDILVGFFQYNQDTSKNIQLAQEGNEGDALLHLAHSLKGSAGNIGARDLQQAAGALEHACNDKVCAEGLADLIHDLQEELGRTLGVLAPLAETTGDDRVEELISGTEGDVETLLATLVQAIDRADPEEIRRHSAEVRKQLAGRKIVMSSVLKTLELQISRYDYDQALLTIQHIRDSVEGQS